MNRKLTANKEENLHFLKMGQEQLLQVAGWLQQAFSFYLEGLALPTLVLSEEKATKVFGRYAYDNIMLSRQRNKQLFAEKQIAEARYRSVENSLEQKLKELRFVEPAYARFAPPNKIVLYKPNIVARQDAQAISLESLLAEILCHELFHYLHYCYLGHKQWSNYGILPAKVLSVKEALAVFCQYKWLQENGLELQVDLLKQQLANPLKIYPSYPYSAAKQLFDASWQEQDELFAEVFKQTATDWQAAYTQLSCRSLEIQKKEEFR